MDWNDARAFLAVARSGTLATAAVELGVNPSTVHRRVRALEAALSAKLFDKTPRGYALTAVGEAALVGAEAAEEALLATQRAVIGHDREASGTVRLTLPDTLLAPLTPLLTGFQQRCANISLDLRVSTGLLDLSRETDVALRIGITPPNEAIAHRLCAVPWGLWRNTDAEQDAPWVDLVGMDQVPAVCDWQIGPTARLRVHRVADALSLLRRGPLQGLLPAYCGVGDPDLLQTGDLHPDRRTSLWLLIHTDLRRSARVRAFVDDFRRAFDTHQIDGLHRLST